jgi:hypothetical protein
MFKNFRIDSEMGNFDASSPFVQYVPHPPGLVFTETMPPSLEKIFYPELSHSTAMEFRMKSYDPDQRLFIQISLVLLRFFLISDDSV